MPFDVAFELSLSWFVICHALPAHTFHMLAKSVADGQNFRRVMETFMSDVQYDSSPTAPGTISIRRHMPRRYRINGSNYSLRSIISEFG